MKAVSRSTSGGVSPWKGPTTLASAPSSSGPISAPAGRRRRVPAQAPIRATATVKAPLVTTEPVASISRGPRASYAPMGARTKRTSRGAVSTTSARRRYCMKATSRASASMSSLAATIPAEPPAIMPRAAVGRSSPVRRARSTPPPTLKARVARVTTSRGSQDPASVASEAGLK